MKQRSKCDRLCQAHFRTACGPDDQPIQGYEMRSRHAAVIRWGMLLCLPVGGPGKSLSLGVRSVDITNRRAGFLQPSPG